MVADHERTRLGEALEDDPIRGLIRAWRQDRGVTYQTWFLWEDRLKNFRSIRRGLQAVIAEISGGRFGNVYRGYAATSCPARSRRHRGPMPCG